MTSKAALLATLPMYDHPPVQVWTDRWWTGLAAHMRNAGVERVPDRVDRSIERNAAWRGGDLLFSQTCGYPLITEFPDVLAPLITPEYSAPGCSGTHYSSAIVVHEDEARSSLAEFKGARCVINGRDSQSGCNALRHSLAALGETEPFFGSVSVSGKHAKSIGWVQAGDADICAIDCVTYALIERYEPELVRGTRILEWTASGPGLLYVAKIDCPSETQERMREGILAALGDPALAEAREALFIAGGQALTLADYEVLKEREVAATASGSDPMGDRAGT